jgi:phosphatidylglycerophosphatase A
MNASQEPAKDNRAGRARLPFFAELVATGLYSGYIRWASGTFGSLVGLCIYLIPGAEAAPILGVLILLGIPLGVITSAKVAAIEGHRLSKMAEVTKAMFQPGRDSAPDPSIVVIDEIIGMWVSLFLLPKTFLAIISAFIVFRALDIVKPFPARRLEKLPNGWGIMLDDIVAGVYANVLTHLILVLVDSFPGT